MQLRNFLYEWKFALFNTLIYSLFITSLFYVTGSQVAWLLAWGWLCSTLGNSVLLHRYYTHKQFKLNKITEYMLLPFAIIIGIGSTIQYALLHRQHHNVCDEIGDPHSPSKLGMLTVMSGLWEFFPTRYFVNLKAAMPKDLIVKPLHRFVHNNYYSIWVISLIICLVINWQVAIAMFSWAAVYQKVWENIVVNGLCHPGISNIKDWKIFGFVTGGESMQKFHHEYPNEVKLSGNWLVDPGYPIVQLIKEQK
jgi:stearoyl-CoA desaturase (delta-9 desaturase)